MNPTLAMMFEWSNSKLPSDAKGQRAEIGDKLKKSTGRRSCRDRCCAPQHVAFLLPSPLSPSARPGLRRPRRDRPLRSGRTGGRGRKRRRQHPREARGQFY